MPTHKAYTFASRTSPDTNQSLQKSMLFPTLRKNKKSPLTLKNKTLQTHNPADNNGMTEQTENIKGMSLEKKEGQLVTKAICNKGFRGISSILPRIKFRIGGQESSPHSLTPHSLNRYKQAVEREKQPKQAAKRKKIEVALCSPQHICKLHTSACKKAVTICANTNFHPFG